MNGQAHQRLAEGSLITLRQLHAAVNAHDAHAIAQLCAENIVWDDPAAPTPLHGRDAVYRFHQEVMFHALPDVRVEMIGEPLFSLDGSCIAVRLRIDGTMTGSLQPPGFAPTGSRVEFETAEFSRFERELLVHQHVVLNMLDLARQIGAAPQAGTFAERLGVWAQHLAAWHARHR